MKPNSYQRKDTDSAISEYYDLISSPIYNMSKFVSCVKQAVRDLLKDPVHQMVLPRRIDRLEFRLSVDLVARKLKLDKLSRFTRR